MTGALIEQALYGSPGAGGYRFLARSPGFGDKWLAGAEQLCTGFGERPAGVSCPGCVFARPFGSGHVAVIQAADQGADDAGRPGALAFYLLVLPRSLYRELEGDPFFIAEHCPPPWQARGDLPPLTWTAGRPPARTVDRLRATLNVPYSPTLLGGVQILLDGGRLVFERSAPDLTILRGLWALLPTSERCELWPASFAYSNTHRFDAVVVPRASGPEYPEYITEEKVGDYPEGRYECNLQSAIETGDQREIDALLNHNRSRSRRLVVLLLGIVLVLSAATSVLLPGPRPARPAPTTARVTTSPPDLPAEEECPALDPRRRAEVAEQLRRLGERFRVDLPAGLSDDTLTRDLALLDKRLGTPDPQREPGPLRDYGPFERQVRALLWKHGLSDYSDRRLSVPELLERLRQRLDPAEGPIP